MNSATVLPEKERSFTPKESRASQKTGGRGGQEAKLSTRSGAVERGLDLHTSFTGRGHGPELCSPPRRSLWKYQRAVAGHSGGSLLQTSHLGS